MILNFANDFEWRFVPIEGQRNRYYFIVHGGDERRFCGESERVTTIRDEDGIEQTVFVTKEKNRKSLKDHFSPINAYQFLHSVLPDHAIRRYFPQVIPAMMARISDRLEDERRKRMRRNFNLRRY